MGAAKRNMEAVFDQLNEMVDANLAQAERAEKAEAALRETLKALAWVMSRGNSDMERVTAEKHARAVLAKHGAA